MKEKNVYIAILKYIPRWYKTLLWSGIGLTVINYALNKFLDDQDIVVTNGLFFVFWTTISLFVIGFFIGLLRALNFLYTSPNETKINSKQEKENKPKKKLPDFFELEIISLPDLEYSIRAFRCFRVDDNPGVETFLKSIVVIPIRCIKCKNPLTYERDTRGSTMNEVYTCFNKICENHFKFVCTMHQFQELVKQYTLQTNSKILNDFNHYWEKYCDIYKEKTNGEYNRFDDIRYLDSLKYYLK